MRVILDTNVVVAALRSSRGASAQILRLVSVRECSIAISASLVFEYEEVLVRELVPAFVSLEQVDQVIKFLCAIGEQHDPSPVNRPFLSDPDDDFLVDLAVSAGVEYVVTHNVRDLDGAKDYGITAITPGQFLGLLREKP
jgi:putative PIN family toxin of toxin-antitoxin system